MENDDSKPQNNFERIKKMQLGTRVSSTRKALEKLSAAVERDQLPDSYDGVRQLANNQITAMENMLADQPLGFELSQLKLNPEIYANSRLKNLAHGAKQAKERQMDPDAVDMHIHGSMHSVNSGILQELENNYDAITSPLGKGGTKPQTPPLK